MNAGVAAAVLWALAFGWLIVATVWPRTRRLRADTLLLASLGLLVGCAATSATFFVASLVSSRPALTAFLAEMAIGGLLVWRLRHRNVTSVDATPAATWNLLQVIAVSVLVQAGVVAAVVASRAYHEEPYGGWDGWAIWNLHARLLLRGGPAWPAIAAAPQLSWTHPDYPRLVPASVARVWAWTGAESPFAAGLISAIFAAALVVLLVAAVIHLRGRTSGAVAGMLLVATPFFVTFSTNEHADIPLAAFMLAAVALAAMGDGFRGLAAVCAAAAAWTKNEGLLFAIMFTLAVGVADVRRGESKRVIPLLAVLALGLLPVAYFKFALAPPSDLLGGPVAERWSRAWDVKRHAVIWAAMWRDVRGFGEWSWTPYLAMALPFLAWTGRRRLAPPERIIGPVTLLMLAGYYAAYLLTPHDLTWHLDTSLVRLLLQVWPIALLGWALRCPVPETPSGPSLSLRTAWAAIALNALLAAVIVVEFRRQPAGTELAFQRGIAATPGEGWFDVERASGAAWVWSQGDATLNLQTDAARACNLSFVVRSLATRRVTVRFGGRVAWQGEVGARDAVRVEFRDLALAAGSNALHFATDVPGTPEPASSGARQLAFALYEFQIR